MDLDPSLDSGNKPRDLFMISNIYIYIHTQKICVYLHIGQDPANLNILKMDHRDFRVTV